MTDDPTHDHHKDLDHAELRDLVAESLRGNHWGFERHEAVERILVEAVEKAQRGLDKYYEAVAWGIILRKFGWETHDVSDDVPYNSETYRCFVGTDEEREARYPGETS